MRNEINEEQKTQYIKEKKTLNLDSALRIGLIGGIAMIGYLLTIEALFKGDLLGIKFLKYFIFAIPMATGISRLKGRVKNKYRFFQNGIAHSAVASATAAILMMIAYFVTVPLDNYTLATITTEMTTLNTSTSDMLVPFLASIMLFLEVFVFSMLTSFGILLYQYDYARTA
jgi:hypothetical protein